MKKVTRASTGFVRARSTMKFAIASSTPVRTSAPETMNMAAMVMGAALEKTAITSEVSTSPSSMKAAAPPTAVTSGGYFSMMNITKTQASSPSETRSSDPAIILSMLKYPAGAIHLGLDAVAGVRVPRFGGTREIIRPYQAARGASASIS